MRQPYDSLYNLSYCTYLCCLCYYIYDISNTTSQSTVRLGCALLLPLPKFLDSLDFFHLNLSPWLTSSLQVDAYLEFLRWILYHTRPRDNVYHPNGRSLHHRRMSCELAPRLPRGEYRSSLSRLLSFPGAENLHHQWLSCSRRAYTKGFGFPSYHCES
jgi:hypothetical protein